MNRPPCPLHGKDYRPDCPPCRATADPRYVAAFVTPTRWPADPQPQLPRVSAVPRRSSPPPAGPGTEFDKLRQTLGLPGGCMACAQLRAKMDKLGVAGCRELFDGLLEELRANAKQFGWKDWGRASLRAPAAGIVFKVNWLDPLPGLLEEAIRRAEQKSPRPVGEVEQNRGDDAAGEPTDPPG